MIPFFAQCKLLEHVEWVWGDDAAQLIQLAPLLEASIEDKHYEPSFSAFQAGKLHWTWDEETWSIQEREALDEAEYGASFRDGLVPHSLRLYLAAIMERKQPPLTYAENIRFCLQETVRLSQA